MCTPHASCSSCCHPPGLDVKVLRNLHGVASGEERVQPRRHGHQAAQETTRPRARKERRPLSGAREAPQPHGKDKVEIASLERQLERQRT
jgi:hypothetical protein